VIQRTELRAALSSSPTNSTQEQLVTHGPAVATVTAV
jgi:hypothetical protein